MMHKPQYKNTLVARTHDLRGLSMYYKDMYSKYVAENHLLQNRAFGVYETLMFYIHVFALYGCL